MCACIDSCACFIYLQTSASSSILDKRDPTDYLAQLTLQQFEFGTNMMSNGNITVRTSMEDCLLDDKRPEKGGGIARYINLYTRNFKECVTWIGKLLIDLHSLL